MTTPETNAAIQQIADGVERIANVAQKIDVSWEAARKTADGIFAKLESLLTEDPEWPTKLGQKFAQAFTLGMMFRPPSAD